MANLAYGDILKPMRDKEIEIRVRNRILKQLRDTEDETPKDNLWSELDDEFVI